MRRPSAMRFAATRPMDVFPRLARELGWRSSRQVSSCRVSARADCPLGENQREHATGPGLLLEASQQSESCPVRLPARPTAAA